MNDDVDAVGGFFEDLPVLAFVLAGVLSVAGTASWTAERLADGGDCDALEAQVSRLTVEVICALETTYGIPSADAIRGANLSAQVASVPTGHGCWISIWCLHPVVEQLLFVSSGEVGAGPSCAGRSFMNVLWDDGIVGILEVRVIVWTDRSGP